MSSCVQGTIAPAVLQAFKDANARWPNRKRASDGTLPSEQHCQQSPNSDHNTGNAFDVTHDPASGPDGELIAELAIADPRTKYVIWNRRIYTPSLAREWRAYTGKNPHTSHVHVSIQPSARNDVRPWGWAPGTTTSTVEEPPNRMSFWQWLKQLFFAIMGLV